MFEAIVPSTKDTRLGFHQILAAYKDMYELGEAQIQCVSFPGHLHIRCEKEFPGSKKADFVKSGEIKFDLDYCTIANYMSKEVEGRFIRFKDDEKIIRSITKACTEGGLADVAVEIHSFTRETLDLGKSRKAPLPVVKLSVTANLEDSSLFEKLVAKGIGKRRSYGLGMLQIGREYYAS